MYAMCYFFDHPLFSKYVAEMDGIAKQITQNCKQSQPHGIYI